MDHTIDRPVASSTALHLLLNRQSSGALVEPAPNGADLDLILDAGLRAPDHGRLRPWRFVVIRGDAKAKWAECVAEAIKQRDPENAQAMIDKYRAFVQRTPLIVAVGAEIKPNHKIPEIEQLLSVGAAAMNMLNAAHVLGYGGMWVTGPNAYDPRVAAALGLEAPSRLVGFLALGTPKPGPTFARPALEDHVTEWVG
ncbi:MAG TPA: nitroreductase [Reyranella sp.]|jgi:nitroreductase|nr:nitroreductase [Reyranella sp.]